MLYILLTKYFCDIFIQNRIRDFDKIKDQILCVSFQNEMEKVKYLKNINAELQEYEEFDGCFLILSKEDLFFIMNNSPENQENIFRNISDLNQN